MRLCAPARAREDGRLQRYKQWLDPADRARLAKTGNEAVATLFVVARGALRELVRDTLDVDPAAVGVAYDELGKPLLMVDGQASPWSISIAHTSRLCGAAMGSSAVGLDVLVLARRDHAGIAERVFTDDERADIAALGDPESEDARRHFYTVWTAKEAWMKARGQGFRLHPDTCELRLDAGFSGFSRLPADDDPARWWLRGWWPTSEHAAALVVDASAGAPVGDPAGIRRPPDAESPLSGRQSGPDMGDR